MKYYITAMLCLAGMNMQGQGALNDAIQAYIDSSLLESEQRLKNKVDSSLLTARSDMYNYYSSKLALLYGPVYYPSHGIRANDSTVAYLQSLARVSEMRSRLYMDSVLTASRRVNQNRSPYYNNYRNYDPLSQDTTITYWRHGVRYTATYTKDDYYSFTHDFEAYFMPGVGYSIYKPSNDTLGTYSGLSIEYLIYGRIMQNDKEGPSHTRFYAKVGLLGNSNKKGSILVYGLGLNLSIERNPKRDFLVPYFGVEAGAISGKDIGSTFQMSPLFGIHIYSKENLYINIHGGYVYPTRNFDDLRGYFGSASVNFSLW